MVPFARRACRQHRATPTAATAVHGDGDGGFTLVELVVALTVISVGVFGLVGSFNATGNLVVRNNNRSRAVAIATKHTESFRAANYEDLAVGGTTTTVTERQANIDFTVVKGVSWASGLTPAGTLAQAYKRATVSVTWSDGGQSHTISQTTSLYPGGYGPAADVVAQPSHGVGNPWPPTALTSALPANAPGTTAVDLSWTPPVTSDPPVAAYDIAYSTDNWATLNQIASATTGSTYRVTNLSAGTSYQFKVRSRSAEGNVSYWFPTASTAPISTLAVAVPTCDIGAFVITPSAVKKKTGAEGSKLTENPVLSVNTSGTGCAGLYATYQPTSTTGDSVNLFKSASGGTWTGSIRGGSFAWDVGVKTVQLFNGAGTRLATAQLTVCDNNAKTCP